MKLGLPGLSFAVLTLFAAPVESATHIVRSRRDSGTGSLRQTLTRAQSGDTILLRTNGTIMLRSELALDKSLTLRGVPSGHNVLSGTDATQILRVTTGVTATLEGLTLEHGFAEGFEDAAGGALRNEGTLTVRNCTFLGNVSDGIGGAILNTGTLVLDRCLVFDNQAAEFGGGVYNAGKLLVNRSTLSHNSVLTGAAAIFNEGDLSIDTSTLSENHGISAGAITNVGHAAISRSTLSTNHATTEAGAIGNFGELLISNSTLSRNSGDTDGAIDNEGQLTLLNSSVVENRALGSAGLRLPTHCVQAVLQLMPEVMTWQTPPWLLISAAKGSCGSWTEMEMGLSPWILGLSSIRVPISSSPSR